MGVVVGHTCNKFWHNTTPQSTWRHTHTGWLRAAFSWPTLVALFRGDDDLHVTCHVRKRRPTDLMSVRRAHAMHDAAHQIPTLVCCVCALCRSSRSFSILFALLCSVAGERVRHRPPPLNATPAPRTGLDERPSYARTPRDPFVFPRRDARAARRTEHEEKDQRERASEGRCYVAFYALRCGGSA